MTQMAVTDHFKRDPMRKIISKMDMTPAVETFSRFMSEVELGGKTPKIRAYMALSQAITDLCHRVDEELSPRHLGVSWRNEQRRQGKELEVTVNDAIKGFAEYRAVARLRFVDQLMRGDTLAEPLRRLVEAHGYDVSDSKELLDSVRGDINEHLKTADHLDRLPIENERQRRYAQDPDHSAHHLLEAKPTPDQDQALTL
jgi:hypothetical protein